MFIKELRMKINKLAIALAAIGFLITGCASNGAKPETIKVNSVKVDKDPAAEINRPKPVSAVFNRPQGPTQLEFTDAGEFLGITARASAPIAGNNAYSIEQATQVAVLRAKRNIAEFMSAQLNTTRTLKVLSHTVQRSKENTANGMADEVQMDDRAFDSSGGIVTMDDGTGLSNNPAKFSHDNVNSERIAQTVRESVSASSSVLLRGLYVVSERIDPAGRVVTVEVHASQKSIGAAGSLRRMMEQAGQ
jgi:hypothetical protein